MKKFSFRNLFKRISTWVAVAGSSASAFLIWYATQVPRVQDAVPDLLVTVAAVLSVAVVIGVPAATSYRQKKLQ